jgi:23S rRNA (uracil1939-C5)-methyltransferase
MIEKNNVYTGEVLAYGTDGEGIVKCEGTTTFVPFCLVGEKITFKILKVSGNIAYGKLVEVLTPSKDRRVPKCPVYSKCGGCDLQHMSYPAQLAFKRDMVKNSLSKIGGLYYEVSPTVPCEREYYYRNKLALPIGVDADGNTVVGFFAPRSHRIVAIENCAIQAEWAEDVIAIIKAYSATNRVKGYDEVTGKGVLRHIVVRELAGKFIFALVVTRKIDVAPLISLIEEKFGEFTFLLNVNPDKTNVIFGKEWHICRGEGFFNAEECGVKFRAGANTFIQVNDDVRTKLYSAIFEQAEEDDVALDLYSGGGMLTAMLAKKCTAAYGIEVVEEASRCADELKKENGLDKKMFNICGTVEGNIERVLKATEGKKKIVVCDPPRKGMERSVVEAIKRVQADKVVLVSCNPATLARDLGLLTGTLCDGPNGLVKCQPQEKFSEKFSETSPINLNSPYVIKSITPFDMFPNTKHCEVVVSLHRRYN